MITVHDLPDDTGPCQQDLDSAPVNTLADIRATLGASGVADAIRRALAAHPTITAAAEALGTKPRALRRAAQRVGVEWPESPRAPGAAGGRRSKAARKQASEEKRSKAVDTRTGRA